MDDEYLEVRKNGGKPRELGDVILEDAETQAKMRTFVSMRMKNTYQQRLEEHIAKLKELCERHSASFISVSTNTPIFEAFYHMFK